MKTTLLILATTIAGLITASAQPINLIPHPTQITTTNSPGFTITPNTRILIPANDKGAAFAAKYLTDKVKTSTGTQLSVTTQGKPADGTILFQKSGKAKANDDSSSEASAKDESYTLVTTTKGIQISAPTDAGLFYAAVTLTQLLPAEIESPKIVQGLKLTVPAVSIKDAPRFSWRGMHLDVSRHFFPKKDILTYLDILAAYKINRFHWHLIDDGGWRLEIKKYPRLTSVGAWRNKESFKWGPGKIRFPRATDPNAEAYGGFYTQEDVKEIVEYARQRNIVVVPEIEMPGHIMPVLAAYPQFGSHPDGGYYTKDRLPQGMDLATFSKRGWGYYHQNVADAGKPETYEFFRNVLDEVFTLFPSPWIHIGGDEVQKHYWENSPWVAELMKKHKLHDQHEVQSYFLKEMNKHIQKNGRRMVGWDEIVDGGLAPGATVMYWIGGGRMRKALTSGHEVVMSPMGPCYFDFAYKNNSTRKMHQWDPMPANTTPAQQKFLIGAQANVWTEWMETWDRVEYMVLPRMTALAETTWNTPEQKDFTRFSAALNNHFTRMDYRGYNYRIPTPTASAGTTYLFEKNKTVTIDPAPNKTWKIRYTTDGSKPTATSAIYDKPIVADKTMLIKASYFANAERASEIPLEIHCKQYAPAKPGNLKPGLNVTYHEVEKPKKCAQFKASNQKSKFTQKDFSLKARQRNDNFGMIFTGFIQIKKPGTYTFATGSDDGSVLKIADTMVVNNDGTHSYKIEQGRVELKPGYYPIEVRFLEAGGAERLDVFIQSPGEQRKPLTELFHN